MENDQLNYSILLEGRNIVYENRFINWNESYNLNN
jgi:hypothetical protein